MIIVVAGLIKKENKVLIAKRLSGDDSVRDKWEFPGGKVELNETEEHAIEREIMEEFEMKIKAVRYLNNIIYEYPSKTVDLRLYACDYVGGNFHLHDHSDYKWVGIDEILEYDLVPADKELVQLLVK